LYFLTFKNQEDNDMTASTESAAPAAKTVHIQVHRIYSKNQRVVIHGLPEEWSIDWNPKLDLQANPRVQAVGENRSEVVLALQLTAKQQDKPVFEIYFEQAGQFTITVDDPQQREMVLYGTCSNMLFPYVGVMINQILAQSSLQPLYLAPMDFIPLYRRHQQQQQTKAQQEREQQNAVIQ
jgi:preprotein translocase subunit SecB